MKKLVLLTTLAVFISGSAISQEAAPVKKKLKKFSAELGVGAPIMMASIPGSFSSFGTLGVRYSATEALSVQASFQIGQMAGTGKGTRYNPDLSDKVFKGMVPDNFNKFENTFMQYGGNIQLNLAALLKAQKMFGKLNPFLLGGAGFLNSHVVAERSDGRIYDFNKTFWTTYAGISIRYYLNPSLDLVLTGNYHMTQTFYVDGAPGDDLEDAYLLPSLGVNYKIGTNRTTQHIEWRHVPLPKGIFIKDPTMQEGQPIAEGSPYIVFNQDSLTKLVEANKKMMEQNDQMRKEITNLNTRLDSVQKNVNDLKEQMKNQPAGSGSQSGDGAGVTGAGATTGGAGATTVGGAGVSKAGAAGAGTAKSGGAGADEVAAGSGSSGNLNQYNDIVTPPNRYNVVVGTYTRDKYAFIFRDRLRGKGYDAAIFRSNPNSRYVRVSILSTTDKKEAFRIMKQARTTIDAGSWIHIYNEQ